MNAKLFDLSGKIALITGSGRGLGLVLARGLAHAGAVVVLNGRICKTLEAAVADLTREGLTAAGYPFDVVKRREIQRQVERIRSDIGPIDMLVNSAGIQRRAPILETEESVWREVLDINLTGTFLASQVVGAGMVERRRQRACGEMRSKVVCPP